jgi:hypothetical protein
LHRRLVLQNDVSAQRISKETSKSRTSAALEVTFRSSNQMMGHLQSVEDARDVTQDCQKDVDEEIGTAATLKEDAQRWEENGEDDLANVAVRI